MGFKPSVYECKFRRSNRILTAKLKIPGKAFLKTESRISVTFKVTIKVEYSILNVTEVLVSDFKNAFPGIFNFTVGILRSKINDDIDVGFFR